MTAAQAARPKESQAMKKVEIITRPFKLDEVKNAIAPWACTA